MRSEKPFRCILIGHSMGGLVCAQYELMHPDEVSHVVAIASPFRGAPLLNYSFVRFLNNTKRHVQMRPRSNFLATLDPRIQVLDGKEDGTEKYLTVGSFHDWQVPNDFATIPHVEHFQVSDCGHFSIADSRDVWEVVSRHVNQ